MKLIREIADKLEIPDEYMEYYGRYTAKLRLELLTLRPPKGRLILVYENGQALGGALFVMQAGRIIYLFSAVSEAGREQQAMSFLLDNVIKEYSDTVDILDFEGSMVPGIASFFRSFGAGKERYFHFKRSRIPFFGSGKKVIPIKGM